jgi:HD superfamily phosphohydrolase
MAKQVHEIRDPIHVFVRLDTDERRVLDSRPFQRLRHIHQLALSYLVYPAATHKRFEHSLGVMELAGRVFDVVTHRDAVSEEVRRAVPEIANDDKLRYWRRVLRMAALCHDTGHLPFSHAAEKELLPSGWTHERLTREIILSEEMRAIWGDITPPLRPEDVVKLALGPREAPDLKHSVWEAILAEILVGDSFGVDRMDYLLRDSHHTGVAYGKFDHFRLIDTLRILPAPRTGEEKTPLEPALGVEEGGMHSAEALLLARYFMFSQVYFHAHRRMYDILLKDFLTAFLGGEKYPTDLEKHLRLTDNEVNAALMEAARDPTKPGHEAARRIVEHKHFKVLYERNPNDVSKNPEAGRTVFEEAVKVFGAENLRHDRHAKAGDIRDFPVLMKDGRIVSAIALSEVLRNLPVLSLDFVFVVPEKWREAEAWLEANRAGLIQPKRQTP